VFRNVRLALALGLLAVLVVGAGTAAAGPGGPQKILDTRLVGLATPGTVIAGVTGAGHAWQLKDGNAKLFADGRVDLHVHGLLFFPEGTQPAANVKVAVSCNGGGAGNIISSGLVPLSQPEGDMHFNDWLTLPSPCLAPAIFVTSGAGTWFAVSG
jgi:hypothetical protein